jgi:hypothetical protein
LCRRNKNHAQKYVRLNQFREILAREVLARQKEKRQWLGTTDALKEPLRVMPLASAANFAKSSYIVGGSGGIVSGSKDEAETFIGIYKQCHSTNN